MQSLDHKLDAAYVDPGKGTAEQDEGEAEVGLSEEDEGEEEAFLLTCPNPGCKFSIADESEEKRMTNHRKVCEFQLEKCQGCGQMVRRGNYVMHQAVRRCSEQLQKRRRVQSARHLSSNLRQHWVQMKLERHASEQTERHLVREFEEQQKREVHQRRRVQSAYPILVSTATEARMSSATANSTLVGRYSRNLMSALESCKDCTTRFTTRPARRDSWGGCGHCQHWRTLDGRIAKTWTS